MRVPVFAPADAALALLLLSVLVLIAVRGLGPMEAGSGFVISAPSDLERIPDMGSTRLREIRPYLTVEEERWPTK